MLGGFAAPMTAKKLCFGQGGQGLELPGPGRGLRPPGTGHGLQFPGAMRDRGNKKNGGLLSAFLALTK